MNTPVRRFKRVKIDVRVRLRRWDEHEDASQIVRSFEIGEGGMSVYASEALVIGTELLMEFSLPGNDAVIRVRAIVRNRRGFRCGAEFQDLTAEQGAEIQRYIGTADFVVEI